MTPTPRHPDTPVLPYGRQLLDAEDLAVVAGTLTGDWLTCGPAVAAFEEALAAYCGAPHAVAVSSGTAALHLAALAARLGPGDRLLTSANTFLASANCAEFAGATADFADIDPDTLCVSTKTLDAAWRPDVKAVVAVDFAGYPCVTKELAAFVHGKGALLIEDGCHAIGGGRDGRRVGGLPGVDMTVFSFHPVKTITTGEGGAILTHRPDLAERCRLLRNHGMVRDVSAYRGVGVPASSPHAGTPTRRLADTPHTGPWYYEMPELGFNYRITDLQCALGSSQLKKLDRFVRRRQQIVDAYNAAFAEFRHADTPIHRYPDTINPAWHLYVVQVDFMALGKTRTDFMNALKARGIGTQVHYMPVHLQPYYRQRHGYGPGKCPVAEAYYETALSLPLFPAMTDADVERVVVVMREMCRG